jgi:hypothetical protein
MEYKKLSLNLPLDLYHKLTDDADVSDRTIGGQIKYVLKNYYGPHPSSCEEVISPEVADLRDDSEVELSEGARSEHIEVHKECAKKLVAAQAIKKAKKIESSFKPMFKGKAAKSWEDLK